MKTTKHLKSKHIHQIKFNNSIYIIILTKHIKFTYLEEVLKLYLTNNSEIHEHLAA